MTASLSTTVRLCLLPGTGNASAVPDSVSCLKGRPDVKVTLVEAAGTRRTLRAAKYIESRFGNSVDVVGPDAANSLFKGGSSDADDSVFIFMPAGDWLSDGGVEEMVSAMQHGADIVYVDQDRAGSHGHLDEPQFKPDANYEYLAHFDYVGDMLCIRKSVLAHYGGINTADYPASRYALLLRAFADGRRVEHIPRPLYHSHHLAGGRDMAKVLRTHFGTGNQSVEILPGANHTFRISRRIEGRPRTTIVIPFRDRPLLLRQCLESVLETTTNPDFDILGISNRSRSSETYRLMEEFSKRDKRIRFAEHNIPFNFSALVNRGAELASGEYIVLMNNDIKVADGAWLDALLEYGQLRDVGVVGAKLLYPDGSVQHAGLSVQQSGHIGHMHKQFPGESYGYMNRLICVQAVSAVTAALCLFSRKLHGLLNGFDEDRFGVAYNDVDFCLRAQTLGRRNIFTPFALAYHHESLSRGYEDTESKKSRFELERETFWKRHESRAGRPDPNYNPNFDQYRDDFSY